MTDDATKTTVKRGVDCIGVCVSFLLHDGNGGVLLHKRSEKCRDECGNWDCGAGALEFGESFEASLRREITEEVCAEIIEIKALGARNVLREHQGIATHWVAVRYAVQVDPTQVQNGEPEKIDEIGWFTIGTLPNPKHTMLNDMIEAAQAAGIL